VWGYGTNEASRRQATQRGARQSADSKAKGAEPGGQPNQSVSGDESGARSKVVCCMRESYYYDGYERDERDRRTVYTV